MLFATLIDVKSWLREDATPLHLAIMSSFKGAGGLEV